MTGAAILVMVGLVLAAGVAGKRYRDEQARREHWREVGLLFTEKSKRMLPEWEALSHQEFFSTFGAMGAAIAAGWWEHEFDERVEEERRTFPAGAPWGTWTYTITNSSRGQCVGFGHPELDGKAVYAVPKELDAHLPGEKPPPDQAEIYRVLRIGDDNDDRKRCGDKRIRVSPAMRRAINSLDDDDDDG